MIVGALIAQLQGAPAALPPAAPAPDDDARDTVVRGRRAPSSPASTRVSPREAQRLPGTQGDVIRVVESMPGVGRASFGGGQLVLWGAAPSSSRVYVDGVPIPRLFHGGGLRSTVNGFFVDDVELSPGGFGAEYGRATGALVRIDSSSLQPAGLHGVATVDLFDSSFAVSRRLSPGWTLGLGIRYGYLADLVGAVVDRDVSEFISLPRYGDYQARLEHHPSPTADYVFMLFGSTDRLTRDASGDSARPRALRQGDDYHRLMVRYASRDGAARTNVTGWVGIDARSRHETVGAGVTAEDSSAWLGGGRASYVRPLGAGATLRAGIDAEGGSTQITRQGSLLRPARDGDVYAYGQPPPDDTRRDTWTVRTASAAPWVELPWSLLRGRLLVTPGVRFDVTLLEASRLLPPVGETPARGFAQVSYALQPRLSATLRVGARVTLKAAGGRYAAPPSAADLSSVFGNPRLEGSTAWHGIAGAQYDPSPAISVEVLGFYREERGLAARPAAAVAAGEALVAAGQTTAFGVQATVRHRPLGRLSGWVTYTLARTVTVDPQRPDGALSAYDQTHLLTAVASVDLGRGWTTGARVRLASGLPRTPVTGRWFDAQTGDYQPVFGAVGSERLPTFSSVDVRIDRRVRIAGMNVTVFVDALNVLNRLQPEEIWYDPTWRERRYITGLPIFVDLGLRGEW